ncbi:hypothetical protein BKA66DRAFT_576771 [Pyrenochaeta sp. MPI-SDFR-AT-0127]|nr:hypothetical protein BKA66DRAFT_576771 [Pyrenochaeta sp. MPI-SDFR-AT-0127]
MFLPSATSRHIGGEIHGTLINTESRNTVVNQARFETNIRMKGGFCFSFLKFKQSKMYPDVHYFSLANLDVSTTVTASYSSDIYNYGPLSGSVSAFTIPGILDVGRIAQFDLGVEFAASGTLNATLGLYSEIRPDTSVSSNVSTEVPLQLNPCPYLSLAPDIRVFKDVIDLTTGIEVKSHVIKAFSADLNFAYTSSSGITFTKPDTATCPTEPGLPAL